MRIYKRVVSLALLLLLATSSPAFASQETPQSFIFQGSGYGHGVGLSQIGARGQALAGETATAILQYYFKDVTIAPVKDDQLLRVNIGHLLASFSLKTDVKLGQVQLFNGDIKESADAVPVKNFSAMTNLNFTLLGSAIFPSVSSINGGIETLPSGSIWTIRWTGTRYIQGPATFVSIKSGGVTTKYRYGEIQVKLVKAAVLGYRMEVTNTVRLHDEYLWGIGEMPSSWPLEALRAQAIASRSFALTKVGKIKSSCDCETYSASQDQAFVGYSKEIEPRYGQLWKAAVVATSLDNATGLAIIYKSLPIAAYFFSSSGGRTAAAVDVWGTVVPYAVSVPDPWSLDARLNSKYVHWERQIGQVLIASAFALPDVLSLQIVSRNVSGAVGVIVGTSSTGKQVRLKGETFRSRINLPSAWFDFQIPPNSHASPSPTPLSTQTPVVLPTPAPLPSLRERIAALISMQYRVKSTPRASAKNDFQVSI
jgi:stage II sporulation protein D